jgi:CpXC protein
MSRFEPAELTCVCGERLQIVAADSLHVTNVPAIREAIKRGEFHVFPCSACGANVRLEKLLAYTDFERWHWFAVFPDQTRSAWTGAVDFAERSFSATVEQRAAPVVQSWAPRFRASMRAIFGLDSLREKLLAFDAGIDDRILELLKLQLIRWYQLSWKEGSSLWFERVDESDQLWFAWSPFTGSGAPPPQQLVVSMDEVRRMSVDGEIRQRAPELFASIAVDSRLMLRSHAC